MEVTGIGIVRRLQALAAMGHPDKDVAAWLDMTVAELVAVRATGEADTATTERVVAVYGGHSMCQGSSRPTERRARKAGWRTALAWDDDSMMDVAAAEPVEAPLATPPAPARRLGIQDTGSDVVAMVRDLARGGATDPEIGRALRCHRNTIAQLRHHHGIPAGQQRRGPQPVRDARPERHVPHIADGPCASCQEKLTS